MDIRYSTNRQIRFAGKPADQGRFVIRLARALRPLVITLAVAPLATVHANPHAAFNDLLDTVSGVRAGSAVESGDGSAAEACDTTAKACYISDVDPVVHKVVLYAIRRG